MPADYGIRRSGWAQHDRFRTLISQICRHCRKIVDGVRANHSSFTSSQALGHSRRLDTIDSAYRASNSCAIHTSRYTVTKSITSLRDEPLNEPWVALCI